MAGQRPLYRLRPDERFAAVEALVELYAGEPVTVEIRSNRGAFVERFEGCRLLSAALLRSGTTADVLVVARDGKYDTAFSLATLASITPEGR